MTKQANRYSDSWDMYDDEDYYPAGDDHELEYWEPYEEEDDDYEHQYSAVQGNWDPREYDEDTYGITKINRKVKSVKTVYEKTQREKKKQQKKIRAEIQAREKQRQKYYSYGDYTEDDE